MIVTLTVPDFAGLAVWFGFFGLFAFYKLLRWFWGLWS